MRAESPIGGALSEEDLRDPDQKAYCVFSNTEPFHMFHQKFQPIIDRFEDDFMLLSLQMETFFYERKQPEEEFKRKREFCSLLKKVIEKHNPDWLFDIVPTGSSVTGLATKDSDLDVAIHIPQADFYLPTFNSKEMWTRRCQLQILQIVRRILIHDEEIKEKIKDNVQLVQAQIQILKIETKDGIECDISVVLDQFLSSMHNSFLIRHFAHIDSRFAPLCAVVKQWAASTEVKNPKDGGFNSYALVLLVVHFLQCGTTPPILPHLAEVYKDDHIIARSDQNFPDQLDFGAPLPRPLPKISKNQAPVAILFFEFAHYYMNFNFSKYYISICNARIMNRRSTGDSKVRNQDQKEVYIEDPFDAHNPGRTVRSLKSIKETLRKTVDIFIPQQIQGKPFKFPTLEDILYMSSSKFSEDITSDRESGEEENLEIIPEDVPNDDDYAAGPSDSGEDHN